MKPMLILSALLLFAAPLVGCDSDDTVADETTIVDLAQDASNLSTLVTALAEAGLVDDLEADGPFTVFAPVNSAFDALGSDVVTRLLADQNSDILTEVLTYHVVPGRILASDLEDGQTVTTLEGTQLTVTLNSDGAFVDGVEITETDLTADNGVVHLIDGVLTSTLDITEVARIQGFDNLVAALDAASLVTTLQGNGPFTVFAPTDEAFAEAATALGITLNELLALENLDEILLYHVVAGEVMAADLSDGQVVTTVNGATFTVDLTGGPSIDTDGDDTSEADIVLTDVPASNGVIHVIDAVLLPPTDG